MTYLVLVGALALLTVGAEWLVRGAVTLARRLGLSPLFIGLTIVGIGTSSPELAASLIASSRGAVDVAVGNVIGSNLFNVAVILGLTAVVCPIRVELRALRGDLWMAVVASALPWLALLLDRRIPAWLGATFLATLAVYLFRALRAARRAGAAAEDLAAAELAPLAPTATTRAMAIAATSVLGGLALLVVGSRLFVDAAIELARALELSERVIGLTVVAAGTSMPELVTSIVAGLRKSPDIAVGNVLGSNVFNVFGVLGASALVSPQTIAPGVLTLDVPVAVGATLLLLPFVRTGGVLSRREGATLLAVYAGYLTILLTGR